MSKLIILKKYKFSKKQIILVGVVGLLLLILAAIYGERRTSHTHREATFVSVTSVVQQDVTVYADVIGSVQSPETVAVKSLVDGQLLKVGFKKGDFVKRGQLLFEIDPRPLEVVLQQAKANLAHDQAQLTATGLALERNRKLLAGKYVAQQDFDQLQANYISAQATVEADQAQVANAALQLSYCTIIAPIDGRAGDLLINVGNVIKANDTNPLVIINQVAPIDVKFALSEKQFVLLKEHANNKSIPVANRFSGLAQIDPSILNYSEARPQPASGVYGLIHEERGPGQQQSCNSKDEGYILVQAKLDANPTVVKTGNISFIDNTVDMQTGMIQLKASFPNSDYYFWPGQFIRITIPLMSLKQALLLSTRAIQAGQNGSYVFLINKDKTVKIKPIKVGQVVGEQTVITDGLQRGNLVVSEGQLNLTEGSAVNY